MLHGFWSSVNGLLIFKEFKMNHLKSFKRALCAAFAFAVAAGAALAQETAPTVSAIAWNDSTAKQIAEAAQTTLANFLTGVGGLVGLVIVAGLAVWGGIALIGVIKRAFQTGKGR